MVLTRAVRIPLNTAMKTTTNQIKKSHNSTKSTKKNAPKIPQVQDGTYNVAVFWPEALTFLVNRAVSSQQKRAKIITTTHAKDRIAEYGLPSDCFEGALAGEVVEATIVDGFVKKLVTRRPSTDSRGIDWCSVVCIKRDIAIVVTIWCNKRSDRHGTLNADRYVR